MIRRGRRAGAGGRLVAYLIATVDLPDPAVRTGAHLDTAAGWIGSYKTSDRNALWLNVLRDNPMTEDQARADCATRVRLGHASTCGVDVDGDVITQHIVRGAQPDPEGWPVVPIEDFEARAGSLWIMQQVILRDASGTTVYADEVARASTTAEAARTWLLDDAALVTMAKSLNVALP